MSSNKKAKQELIRLYGEECFIEKLKLRKDSGKYNGKGQYKKMKKLLTYHHMIEKRNGGEATVENGALLSAENHAWFNKQNERDQKSMNDIFRSYKKLKDMIRNFRITSAQLVGGEVVKTQVNEIKMPEKEEFIEIPAYDTIEEIKDEEYETFLKQKREKELQKPKWIGYLNEEEKQ